MPGPGIPPEAKDKVFDWFETYASGSRHRGAGLGLSLVRSFVQLHGGDVSFEEAWPQYQAGGVYGLFMWGITLRVDPPIIKQFVTRLGTAVADHDSFGLLGV